MYQPTSQNDYGKGYDDEYDRYRKYISRKWVMFIFFIIQFFVSLVTFALCIWVRFDLDFKEWVRELNWYSYWYCTYVIMITMVINVIVSIFGALGVYQDKTGSLTAISWTLGFLFFMQLIGAIVICIWGVEESDILVNELHEVFIDLVNRWDTDPRASRILKQIQEYVGCCGADGSDDFINALKPVPFECRDFITGVEYGYGCMQQLPWWLEPWTATLAGSCCFLCIADIFGIFFIRKLNRAVEDYND